MLKPLTELRVVLTILSAYWWPQHCWKEGRFSYWLDRIYLTLFCVLWICKSCIYCVCCLELFAVLQKDFPLRFIFLIAFVFSLWLGCDFFASWNGEVYITYNDLFGELIKRWFALKEETIIRIMVVQVTCLYCENVLRLKQRTTCK